MPLIRYPGSKAKLVDALSRLLPESMTHELWCATESFEYREPFFGSGAIGFRLMESLNRRSSIWINDIDGDLACLWQTVRDEPKELMRRVVDFTPSVDAFYEMKNRDNVLSGDSVDRGFRKLALHRMSMSGFGYMSGGPLGGRNQRSDYNVNCRWNPTRLKMDIQRLHRSMKQFANFKITSLDFEKVIAGADGRTMIYCDPPYYQKGSQLYRFSMTDADHKRLARLLLYSRAMWLASYDDHLVIRQLYAGCCIESLRVTYTNAVQKAGRRPKNKEIAIASPSLVQRLTA